MGDITEKVDIVINESGGRTVKRSLDDIADSAQRGVQPVNNLKSSLNDGTSAADIFYGSLKRLGGILATLKLTSLITESATLSQRYSELGIVLDVVGRNAGLTKTSVDATTEAVRKQGISMIESRQIVTRMIQSQIDLSKATELARLAQDAAVIGQMNSSQALDTLVHGIQSAQVDVLRTIGLNVNFEQSYAKLAKKMGVTQNALTENEKLQARLNVVLGEASKISGVYEGAMANAGKQMRSTQRIAEDLKVKIGGLFDQTSIFAVTAYTNALKEADSNVENFTQTGQLKAWGDSIARIAAFAADSVRSVGIVFDITGKAIGAMAAQVVAISKFDWGTALSIQGDFNKDFDAAIGSMSKMRDLVESQIVERDLLTKATERETISLKSSTVAETDNADAKKKQADEYKKLISSIRAKVALNNLEIETYGKLTDADRTRLDIDLKIKEGALQVNEARKSAIDIALKELAVSEKLLANKQFVLQQSESLAKLGNNQTNQARQQLDTLRYQNSLIGLNKDQVIALTAAKNLETAATIRNAAAYAGDMHDAYIQYANDLETEIGLQKQIFKEQQIQDYAQAWRNGWSSIEQTARNAFVQFSAHGVSAVESIGQAIKTSIIDALYQLTVRRWIINIGTSIEGALLNGVASAGTSAASGGSSLLNIASLGSSVMSGIRGGFGIPALIGRGLSSFGGSGLLGSFGAGMTGGSSAAAFIGAESATAGAGLAAGMGASFAAAAGPLMIAYAATAGLRALAGDKRLGGGFGNFMNKIGNIPILGDLMPVIPLINALFGRGPLKQKETSVTGAIGLEGFESGMLQARFQAKGGLFRSNKTDFARVDAVTGEVWTDNQKQLGAFAQGLSKASKEIFGAFNDTAKQTSETLKQVGKDLGLSNDALAGFNYQINLVSEKGKMLTEEQIGQEIENMTNAMARKLLPTVDDFAKRGETALQTVSRLGAEFTTLADAATLLFGKTAEQSKALINQFSFGDRTAFLDKAGGADAFAAMVASFSQNFLTDDQRMRPVIESLVTQRDKLGLSNINTRDQYVSAVQSGRLNQDQLLFLLKNQDAINSVFTYLDKISQAAPEAATGLAAVSRELNIADADRTEYGQRLNNSIQQTSSAIAELEGIAKQLMGTVNQINPLSVTEARNIVSGGNANDPRLQTALSTLSDMGTGEFSNVIDFQRAKAKNVAAISSLQDSIATQVSAKNKELDQFNFEKLMLQAGLRNAAQMFSEAASFDVGGYVPRTGMAIIHKDEQVLTPGQQDRITAEIQKMRQELSAALATIAKHTEKTATLIDDVSAGGTAILTEAA